MKLPSIPAKLSQQLLHSTFQSSSQSSLLMLCCTRALLSPDREASWSPDCPLLSASCPSKGSSSSSVSPPVERQGNVILAPLPAA